MNLILVYALVVVTTFLWGANFVLADLVLADFSASGSAAVRFLAASLLLLVMAKWQGAALLSLWRAHYRIYLLLGVIGIAGFNELFFWAMQTTSADNAALIMATNPLITTLLATVFLRERLTGMGFLAMLVALFGVMIVISHGDLANLLSLHVATGDWLMLAANICWAFYNILGRKWMPVDVSALANTALTLSSGAMVLLIIAIIDGQWVLHTPQATAWWAMLAFVVGGTVLAYMFWNIGIASLGAAKTALFMNLVPVFTFLCAMTLGEYPSEAQWLGGLVVLSGLMLSIWANREAIWRSSHSTQ